MTQSNRPRITRQIPAESGLIYVQEPHSYMMANHHGMQRVSRTSSTSNETFGIVRVVDAIGIIQYCIITCVNNSGSTTDFGGTIRIDGNEVFNKTDVAALAGNEGAIHPIGGTFWKDQKPWGMYLAAHYFNESLDIDMFAGNANVQVAVTYKLYLMSGNSTTNIMIDDT